MKPKFYKDEDGDEKGYYGRLYYLQDDSTGDIMHISINTPYFEHKLDCEAYTRKLAEANDMEYSYVASIWFHHGYWRR